MKSDGVTPRDMPNERIRNLKKQSPNLKNITFQCRNFLDIDINKLKGYVIYCDPPYRNTTQYETDSFPYDEFYNWCIQVSKYNTVLISEYSMPEEFQVV